MQSDNHTRKTPQAVLERIARHRLKRLNAGLCVRCGKNALTKKTFCDDCAEKARLNVVRRNKARISSGLCAECGRRPVDENKQSCSHCRDKTKAARNRIKWVAFQAYGGAACSCCGEKTFEFLTLDHINNDGGGRYRKIGGARLYAVLSRKGFPAGFRVLCFNCNSGRHIAGGTCPHELQRQKLIGNQLSQISEVACG